MRNILLILLYLCLHNLVYAQNSRFIVTSKDGQFYFIDKNGNEVTKLGKWDKANQFNDIYLANIQKDGKNYVLDTLGNSYGLSYNLASVDNSIVALDLSDTQLDSFPTSILQHIQLQVLLFSNDDNYLSRVMKNFKIFPTEIVKLQNLKYLQLRSCQIDNLAPQIGKLTNLIALDLRNNELKDLPAQIEELKNLTILDLNNNELTSFPTQIGELKNLTTLFLFGNSLNSLPPQIGDLKNLITLDLSSNKLSALPPQISNLTNLRTLDLTFNKFNSFPVQLLTLKNLTALDLSDNQLTSLPSQIGELKNLTTLDFNSNQLSSLPSQIGELKNLTNLYLINNQLSVLPSEIGELKNLTYLGLGMNQLNSLPSQIGDLKNLTNLDISVNQLSSLPSQISELKNLTKLDLDGNNNLNWEQVTKQLYQISKNVQFTTTPEYAQKGILWVNVESKQLLEVLKHTTSEQMSYMTSITLDENQLDSLPIQIGKLKNLTTLALRSNQLSSLSSQIGEFKNLESLHLQGNNSLNWQQVIKELSLLGKKIQFRLGIFGDEQQGVLLVDIEAKQLLEVLKYATSEQVSNITSLYLGDSQLSSLPSQISKLKNLKKLNLGGNAISKKEQGKIRKLLPNCEIEF